MTPEALPEIAKTDGASVRRRIRPKRLGRERGVALVLVLGALTILAVMLTDFQDETSAELGSALSTRDSIKAEYAARSALQLSRLLIAAEPTIRKGLAIFFIASGGAPPQIPVWDFADQVLGAFNDAAGLQKFALASVSMDQGKKLGIQGAGFDIDIIDEDSKIDLNTVWRSAHPNTTRGADPWAHRPSSVRSAVHVARRGRPILGPLCTVGASSIGSTRTRTQ